MSHYSYLIMAGGTGGHVFPALAVAKELMSRGATVCWLGTELGMESHLVPAENIDFKTIAIKGFRGKRWLSKLIVPFLLCRAIIQSMIIIRSMNPSAVIGFGGFVAAPGGIAARLLGKKLIIHEQNSVAGTTNKLLSKISHKSLEAFPNSLPNAIHVGNPVRASIANVCKQYELNNSSLRVLIMGGSLGAKAINDVVPFAMAMVNQSSQKNNLEIWHQTGKNKKQPVEQAYQTVKVTARIEEFIDDVAEAYQWADVLICRAGALTVSEVAAAGLPAIFVPLPSAIDNHQFYNAKWLVDNNASLLIEQKELSKEQLSSTLTLLSDNREKIKNMSLQLKQLALPDAANQAANHCEELCHAI